MEAFTRLDALAVPLARANIDTDQIVPALYLQKPRSDNFGDYLFHDVRHDARGRRRDEFVLNAPVYADARILVAGPNFGCGSSREHAVWALYDGGFRAVIAPSFGDIFFSNALKNGLLPVRLPEAVVQRMLDDLLAAPGTRMAVDLRTQTVTGPGGRVESFHIDPFPRQCLLEGLDEIDYTLAQHAAIDAFEQGRARGAAPL
ncbi:3-isopropylmalate/(R)-2-methylmalate dehydratase small subunit [Variovorax boronicumulans]|uniref:3-isopropylmalate dehydratase small subunit n=1 Tax=Variovorax boronicumulans TaxID=436515 RepID=A0AAW8CLP9_9BURK|nr:3-isopropylmalate dehydratase small subunit [Variovorax boronicumulans]MDP9892303.1 3-isopropylmalate/(R)-2-methylmalate dehydratase small subunit [Variovorax boronicumulans]MDQ0052218.1 3-isopropylmalate/(R)-2-methylmalate dehydratase small subunit [Variovorax boronicumulans]